MRRANETLTGREPPGLPWVLIMWAMKRALTVALCTVLLLSGCARRAAHVSTPPPPVTTTTTSTTTGSTTTNANGVGSGGTGKSGSDADGQISSTDTLLTQLDSELDADAKPAQDAD